MYSQVVEKVWPFAKTPDKNGFRLNFCNVVTLNPEIDFSVFLYLGIAVRSNMDATITNQYCAVISRLADQARSTIRDLDPTNDITFLRLRSKKNEVLIAPGNKISF